MENSLLFSSRHLQLQDPIARKQHKNLNQNQIYRIKYEFWSFISGSSGLVWLNLSEGLLADMGHTWST